MRPFRLLCSLGTALLMTAVIPVVSFARDASGEAVAVVQSARAAGPGGSRTLQVQSPVFSGDVVNTGPVGEAQILFRDKTRLVVAPNSSLKIDRFVFNPERTVQDVTITATKGAFRFFSGEGPKEAYAIRTPSMTIGIRGTVFDVVVLPNGASLLASYGKKASPRR